MRRAAAILLALLAVLPARAAEPEAEIIREIRLDNTGPGQVDPSFVSTHTGSRTNQPLDSRQVARDVRALLDTGRFTDVRARSEPSTRGVRLVYTLHNRYRLAAPVEVVGAEHFSDSRIRKFLDLDTGDLVDDQVLGVRVRKVEEEYRLDFYPKTAITWEIRETSRQEGLARVTVTIVEGGLARVREVQFVGNTAIPDKLLRRAFKPRVWWNPISWFGHKPEYEPDILEAVRLDVRDQYLDRGYLDVVVAARVDTNDADRVSVIVTVQEKAAYKFGGITLSPSATNYFPQAAQAVKARPGQPASRAVIQSSVQALRDLFGGGGYISTQVRPVVVTNPDPTNATADVRFDVLPGNLTHIRNIDIRGNTRTRDKVIRRELLVAPGDIFNEVKVRRSERIVQNLGFFETVRTQPEDTRLPEEKDLVIDVEEKRTGNFMVGAGFSSYENVMGFVELSQGNFDLFGWPYFTGGGQKLRLRTEYGSKRKEYELSFVEPWFLDRKLALGLDLYRREYDYDDYDLKRTGGAISLSKSLPWASRVSLRYSLERDDISNIADTNRYVYYDDPTEDYYFNEEEDLTKSTVGLTLSRDTRNSTMAPTHGNRSALTGELSGGPFGFDADVYSLEASTAQYLPLWYGHVLSLRLRGQVVDAYGDMDEMPISERLFIGGGRTIRGYDYRDVGPKVVRADAPPYDDDYRAVGGQSLALAKLEYTVPLVKYVRFAGFYDIGNVWRDPYEFDFSRLASGAGVGLRLDLPGFPIRIDYAWDLEKDTPITETDSWVFWIGFD